MKPNATVSLAAFFLVCCTTVETEPEQNTGLIPPPEDDVETVLIRSGIKDNKIIDTKSILNGYDIEDKITCITLAAYDKSGILRDAKHFTSDFSAMAMTLLKGSEHNIYALVNMGDMSADMPARESDLAALTYTVRSYDRIASDGIPMSGVLKNLSGGNSGTIELDRLFAKLSVRILHTGLKSASSGGLYSYDLCNKSIYLRQANTRLSPFSLQGSRALDETDTMAQSDYHADLNNRSEYDGSLQQSELGPGPGYFKDTTVVFYVPENVQGQLLAGNVDPFLKVPEKISSINGKDWSGICTYLEFNAKREKTDNGYGGGVTYRYYLGADSTTDFSIERNCKYNITLDFTDEGFFVKSWKMTRHEDWTDTRVVRFLDKPYSISKGGELDVMVHYHNTTDVETSSVLRPSDWEYKFDDAAMAAAGLTYTIDKNSLVVGSNGFKDFRFKFKAASDAVAGASFPLKVMTWDGSISDITTISVTEPGVTTVEWDYCPMYVSQEGCFTVNGTDSGKLPLSVSGYDENILNVTRTGQDSFKVTALDAGGSSITIKDRNGEIVREIYMSVQAPVLRFETSTVSVNPDGTSSSVNYRYLDKTGSTLAHVNESIYTSVLKPEIRSNIHWLSSNAGSSALKVYMCGLTDSGSYVETGTSYSAVAGACGCPAVQEESLSIFVTDPFAGIRSGQHYGSIQDCTLAGLGLVNEKIKNYFAGMLEQNSDFVLEAPMPNASESQIGASMEPIWEGDFSNPCGTFGINWKLSSDSGSGASFEISRKSISATTKHSAGRHNVNITVTNRHSGEVLSRTCGTIDIYVHVAAGATAVSGVQDGSYKPESAYGTFASVYDSMLHYSLLKDSHPYIYYMDVSVDFLVPVSGIYVFDRMASGIKNRQNIFNCLDIIQPSVSDGTVCNDNLLISVYDNRSGDRTIVCNEPFGYRKGFGSMLYRAVLTPGRESELSQTELKTMMLGYNSLGSNNKKYSAAYEVHDMNLGSDMSLNTVSRGTPFYFSPTSMSSCRDSEGRGYHVIHFLDTIDPESCGWTNLL